MSDGDETPRGEAALPPAGDAARRASEWYRRATVARARLGKAEGWSGLRILCYHRICTERDVLSVPPDMFRRQLEYALGTGARPVQLAAALEDAGRSSEARSFCVTFDDGYEDTLSAAFPALRELSVPATVYLPTSIIAGCAKLTWYREPPRMLDWSGVRELVSDGLVEPGGHSRTHPALTRLDEQSARSEIAGCRDEIGEQLGEPPATFSYPAGLYGERERGLVVEAGYAGAVTVRAGVYSPGDDRHALARTVVYGGEPLSAFATRFDGRLDVPSRLRARVLSRRAKAAAVAS